MLLVCSEMLRTEFGEAVCPCFGIRGNFCFLNPESEKSEFWNPEFLALESAIQIKESGIPLTIGIRNLSSTDVNSGIRNQWRGNQNPRLSWTLHGARYLSCSSTRSSIHLPNSPMYTLPHLQVFL